MDTANIRKFCETLDTKYLDQLSGDAQILLIDACFTCLFYKQGNQNAAVIALQHYKQIKYVANSWVYTGDYNLSGFYGYKRYGVSTIPVLNPEDIESYRQELIDTIREFPEYARNKDDPDLDSSGHRLVYTLGGFAAFGNPASFHNPFVRKLRQRARERILPFIKEIVENMPDKKLKEKINMEMLIDRMMYRIASQSPSAESWHRDVMKPDMIEEKDELYGGWINLDTTDQYFSCIPGSHLGIWQKALDPGFAMIKKGDINVIGSFRHKFRVPPGHMIIFPQYILHEVVATKTKHDMMRLFTGWRLTVSKNFLHRDFESMLDRQSIVPLPGSMKPPMYASNHGSLFLWKQFKPIPDENYKVSTIEWSNRTMKPVTLIDRPAKNGKPSYKIVRRHMLSLEEYELQKYEGYSEAEKDLYRPNKVLTVKAN